MQLSPTPAHAVRATTLLQYNCESLQSCAFSLPSFFCPTRRQLIGGQFKTSLRSWDDKFASLGLPCLIHIMLTLFAMHTIGPLLQYCYVLPQSRMLTWLDSRGTAACVLASRSKSASDLKQRAATICGPLAGCLRCAEGGISSAVARFNACQRQKKAEAQSLLSRLKTAGPAESAV